MSRDAISSERAMVTRSHIYPHVFGTDKHSARAAGTRSFVGVGVIPVAEKHPFLADSGRYCVLILEVWSPGHSISNLSVTLTATGTCEFRVNPCGLLLRTTTCG